MAFDLETAKPVGGGGFDLATARPALPEKQSLLDEMASGALTGFQYGGPLGAMVGVMPAASRAVEEAAYEAGSKVTEMGSRAGLSPKTAAGIGYATNVGIQAVPAVVGGFGAGKIAAPVLEDTAKTLMQSALKPTLKDLKSGKAATAIQTMLDEGVNVTMGGVAQLKQKIGELNADIAAKISNSTAVIDKHSVYGPLKETLDRFSKQINPNADMATIRAAWDEFVSHPLITGDLPVQLAQELKQGTYKILSKKYGQLGDAAVEAQKSIARGLKEQIAKAVPEVSGLNAQESRLLATLGVAERRALMEANKNPMGLSLIAAHPAAWAAFMADRSGLFKSLVARMLHSGSERIPQAVVGAGIAAVPNAPQSGGGILSQPPGLPSMPGILGLSR